MSKIQEYLITRKEELEKRLNPLAALLEKQRKALAETEAATGEILYELAEVDTALSALVAAEEEALKKPKPKLTIKGAILSVLRKHPEGLTSGEILKQINTRYFDGAIKRESLSPQLTRLKRDDRKIDLKGELWFRLSQGDEANLFATKR